MPVDPQIQALLDKATGVPATHTLPVDVARAQGDYTCIAPKPSRQPQQPTRELNRGYPPLPMVDDGLPVQLHPSRDSAQIGC